MSVKWTQREEMHLDYGGEPGRHAGSSVTVYSVAADGVKTNITRCVTTGPDCRETGDAFECRGNIFDIMDPDNKGKFPVWLERMYQGEDNPPRLIEQPAGDIPMVREAPRE